MAVNKPNARKGAVKERTQLKNPQPNYAAFGALSRSKADMARLVSINWRRSPIRTACSTDVSRNLLVNSGSSI